MHLFLVAAVPIGLILGTSAVLYYVWLRHPSALALGSAFPKWCVVSWDEIHNYYYYENYEQEDSSEDHLRRQTSSQRSKVARSYVGQMAGNTKLIQQVMRFEKLKIDPHKSSLAYDSRETLILRIVDQSSDVRWFLAKAQAGLRLRSCVRASISLRAMKRMLIEYKKLEQDFVALVAMASEEAHYNMLVERLGLSGWRLMDGGSPGTPAT